MRLRIWLYPSWKDLRTDGRTMHEILIVTVMQDDSPRFFYHV